MKTVDVSKVKESEARVEEYKRRVKTEETQKFSLIH